MGRSLKLGFTSLIIGFALPTLVGAQTFNYFDPSVYANAPKLLSSLGIYSSIAGPTKTMIPSAEPYEVNTPLFSDGLSKRRWILLKTGTSVGFVEKDDYWDYPDEAVFIKEFSYDTVPGNPATKKLWETRVLINHKAADVNAGGKIVDQWYGFSYKWNAAQTDADLIGETGLEDIINIYPNGPLAPPVLKKWIFPGQKACMTCHQTKSTALLHGRGVLGFFTAQLNRPSLSNSSINQIDLLFQKKILTGTEPTDWTKSPKWAAVSDNTASLDLRARSYVAANCSGCHGTRGLALGAAKGRFNYDYHDMVPQIEFINFKTDPLNLDKVAPLQITPALVVPGYPEKSLLLYRQTIRNTSPGSYRNSGDQMPPLGTFEVNTEATEMLKAWILSLAGTPIHSMESLPASAKFRFSGRKIFLPLESNSPGGEVLSLLSLEGKRIPLTPLGSGVYAIPASYPAGIYFLRIGKSSQRYSLNIL